MLGKNIGMLMPESFNRDFGNLQAEGLAGMSGQEVMAIRKVGDLFPAELSISEMTLSGQRYFIGIVRDITERKAAERKIIHLAHHDYLTDLPNRALFLDRLEQAIVLAKRASTKVAIVFLDLDGFKLVNDRLGHDVGDMLLQAVAGRLGDIVRSSDTIARVGGDEFTLVLNHIGYKQDALLVADKIIGALSEPFDLRGEQCRVGCSIGVAIFPEDAEDPKLLLKRADEAMYLAKQGGKNRCIFYKDEAVSSANALN